MPKKPKNRKYLFGQVESFPVVVNFVMNAAELHDYLPKGKKFNVKRIYWITNWQNEKRSGQHCHNNNEEELFVVINGSATAILDDDGKGKRNYKIKKNDTIFIPKLVWHGWKDASDDFVLLALTTTNYDFDRKGYIENYSEFKKLFKKK